MNRSTTTTTTTTATMSLPPRQLSSQGSLQGNSAATTTPEGYKVNHVLRPALKGSRTSSREAEQQSTVKPPSPDYLKQDVLSPEQGLPGLSTSLLRDLRQIIKEEVGDALRTHHGAGAGSDSDLPSPLAVSKPTVRFSDRGSSRTISKRPAGLRRAGSISESSGTLFAEDGEATPMGILLFEALATYLARELSPINSLVVTPEKMATFYERYTVTPEPISGIAELFRGEHEDDYEDVERLYDTLECQYHLVRESISSRARPQVPGLTPQGFSRFMTISVQAYPDLEFKRLQRATSEMPILASPPASPMVEQEGEKLPSELIRSFFPAKHSVQAKKLFDSAMSDFSEDHRDHRSLAHRRYINTRPPPPPAASSSAAAFDPRRYIPGHLQEQITHSPVEIAMTNTFAGPRHSVPNIPSAAMISPTTTTGLPPLTIPPPPPVGGLTSFPALALPNTPEPQHLPHNPPRQAAFPPPPSSSLTTSTTPSTTTPIATTNTTTTRQEPRRASTAPEMSTRPASHPHRNSVTFSSPQIPSSPAEDNRSTWEEVIKERAQAASQLSQISTTSSSSSSSSREKEKSSSSSSGSGRDKESGREREREREKEKSSSSRDKESRDKEKSSSSRSKEESSRRDGGKESSRDKERRKERR